MDVPVACSLTSAAARSQLDEWRGVLGGMVTGQERISPTEVALWLAGDLGALPALVRLAQREKACCPFFDFRVGIEADRVALRVSVPADAAAILDDFARLAG
jgi:hypothetical protein